MRLGALAIGVLPVAGCGGAGTRPTIPPSAPLRIAAASDLQGALPVLAQRFTHATRVEVVPIFGASGQLAAQIKAGAPFDVFLAANRAFVEDLAAGGYVRPESVAPYARGTLVLAVRGESGATIAGLADLARPEVRKVALANPAFAPYGAAGKQALERAGLWAVVSPKVVGAATVREALQFVESGNAEAGLVGRAVALAAARRGGVRVVEVDPALYDPIVQALGVVARSRRTAEAESFARFVLGDAGQALLAEHGFSKPGTSSRRGP